MIPQADYQVYQVGGSVRDRLLGRPIKDRDWVVVGATASVLLKQGYRPVGKDFPVFLHPETHEEYALARTERKTAPGYHGFVFHSDADVTLEQDLSRRDLTINAMALDANGQLIDPFNGQQDLENKILRHVSPAFTEDPVRVLRLAKFAARFDFTVADETRELIAQMIAAGELNHLVPERIWQELSAALLSEHPARFFETLRDVDALAILFPEIDNLFGVPQDPRWHPEIDTGVHVMMVLTQAARLSSDLAVRFAALCHDLGKAVTPKAILPSHRGHEATSVTLTKQLCQRLKAPKEIQTLALKVAEFHTHVHLLFELPAAEILRVFEALDAFRKPERFEQYLLAGEADFRGRPGYEDQEMPEKSAFQFCYDAANAIHAQPFIKKGLVGADIADAIRQERIDMIEKTISLIKL